jgi:hypothetical protein
MRNAARHPAGHRARRAFGFLEVVLSVALLSGVVVAMVSGYNTLHDLTLRQQRVLEATEVAHRLILIYTYIGPNDLPRAGEAIEQGTSYYLYRKREEVLVEDGPKESRMASRGRRRIEDLTPNERISSGLILVTIDVYPYSPTGTMEGEPLASLSRIFDATDPSNQTDEAFLKHILGLLGSQAPLPQPKKP